MAQTGDTTGHHKGTPSKVHREIAALPKIVGVVGRMAPSISAMRDGALACGPRVERADIRVHDIVHKAVDRLDNERYHPQTNRRASCRRVPGDSSIWGRAGDVCAMRTDTRDKRGVQVQVKLTPASEGGV